eukprot:162338-Prymnesium_polylepis.1
MPSTMPDNPESRGDGDGKNRVHAVNAPSLTCPRARAPCRTCAAVGVVASAISAAVAAPPLTCVRRATRRKSPSRPEHATPRSASETPPSSERRPAPQRTISLSVRAAARCHAAPVRERRPLPCRRSRMVAPCVRLVCPRTFTPACLDPGCCSWRLLTTDV